MDFKIYLPREIKKPLIWFVIASVIGIIIQSSKAGHFVFIDFFGKNYLYVMKTLWDGFITSALLLGFFNTIILLLEVFYYIIMTISLIIIIYHLIATFNKKNTKKLVLYLVIIVGVIILLNSFAFQGKVGLKDNKCPEGIIPDRLLVVENKIFGGIELANGNIDSKNFVTPKWADETEIKYDIFNPPCHQGSSEGENVNNLYCSFIYSKTTTNISDEGVIGKTENVEYKINFVLERDDSPNQLEVVKSETPSARLVYYKVISPICMEK